MAFLSDNLLCRMYAPPQGSEESSPRFHCKFFESLTEDGLLNEKMRRIARKRRDVLQSREIEENDWFLGLRLEHEVPLEEAAMDFTTTPIIIDGERTTHAGRYSGAYEKNFGRANSYCNKKCGPLECRAIGG